jgi:anti-sigma regulatory factor (Ser/Thr protein kinase)
MTQDPAPLHLRFPGLPDWIEPTTDYLVARARQAGAIPSERVRRLMTALHEALTNAVIHGNLGISSELKERGDDSFLQTMAARCADPAYAGRVVDVQVSHDDEFARWTITDEGEGFDAAAALRRLDHREPDASLASGRGLMLIRAFVDEMRYEDRGRRLVLGLRRPASEEKRVQPRQNVSRGVQVTPVSDQGEVNRGAAREAVMRNVSADGVALLQAEPAPAGRVLITIPTPGEPIEVMAEVRHWHELGDSVVEVGCRFEKPVPLVTLGVECADDAAGSAVATLVQRLAQQQRPASERRSALRVSYTEAIQVEVEGQRPVRGFGRDLSRGGLSFFTTGTLPPEVVTLSLPAGGEGCILVRAKVVRCTRMIDGLHEVAVRFVPS